MAQETARTLGGTVVTWSQALSGGQPITLEVEDGVTWLPQETVDALRAMATQAGAVFQLEWEGETHDVMFRHHEPPAVSLKPAWPHSVQYVGTIKLMQI